MELVYYWTTATYPKTIEKPQGFNLSPEYDFCVKKEHGVFYLEHNSEWKPHVSIFQKDNIRNLSVIVGENGAGKSAILRRLFDNAAEIDKNMENDVLDRDSCPYPDVGIKGIGMPFLYIMVFKNLQNRIHVYSSVPNLDYSRIKKMKPSVHEIGGRKKSNLYKKHDFPFQDVTIIYLTNSIFSSYGKVMSEYEGIHSISITPDTIKKLEYKYYERLFEVNEAYPYKSENNPYLTMEWIERNQIKGEIQNLLYLLYFHKMICLDNKQSSEWKSPIPFSIHIQNIPGLFSEYLCKTEMMTMPITFAFSILMLIIMEAERHWESFLPNEDLVTRVLYFNLVIEVILRLELWKKTYFFDSTTTIVDTKENTLFESQEDSLKYSCYRLSKGMYTYEKGEKDNYRFQLESEGKTYTVLPDTYRCHFWHYSNALKKRTSIISWIKKKADRFYKDDIHKSDIQYIYKALDEISIFTDATRSIVARDSIFWEKNLLEKENGILYELTNLNFSLEFRNEVVKDSNKMDIDYIGEYKTIIECLRKLSENKHSFVLKYLSIKSKGMSSGEKAFLNFFSWLSELPFLLEELNSDKTIKARSSKNDEKTSVSGLKKNILFLIDEPDLYMHPQWQKNLVKYLTDELHSQYSDKIVQVIMTTNSPLTLSDIPVENTIRIMFDRKTGERSFSKHCQDQDNQTFGADIYKLFLDSFFMKGSPIGAFAEEYINVEILKPLTKMRLYIWEYEVSVAKGEKIDELKKESKRQEFKEKLPHLLHKIEMISNVALYKKAYEMYKNIMEWCE